MSTPDPAPTQAPSGEPSSPARPSPQPSLGRSVRLVSGLTLLSRVLGLGRDLVTAALFGSTGVGSTFAAGFAVPNLFRRLFGEGALSAALVPEFVGLDKHDRHAAARFATTVAVRVGGGLALITIAVELGLLGLWLSSDGPGDRRLSIGLAMAMLPYMPLVCLVGLLAGVLQARGRFVLGAAAPVILNLVLIAVGLGLLAAGVLGAEATAVGPSEAGHAPDELASPGLESTAAVSNGAAMAAYAMSAAVVLAGVLQVGWAVLAARRERLLVRRSANLDSPPSPPAAAGPPEMAGSPAAAEAATPDREAFRGLVRRFIPAVVGLGALQLSTLVDLVLAMWPIWVGPTILGFAYPLDESSNAVLFYAQRLYQLPLGVFGLAVATVSFPAMSRAAGDGPAFASALRQSLRLSLFIALPASVGLVLVGRDIAFGLFSGLGERFTDDGADRVAAALAAYALGVWAFSANHVLARACYAAGDTKTPVRTAVVGLAVNVCLNIILIWWLREAGLGLATALTAAGQMVVYAAVLRRTQPGGRLLDRSAWAAIGRSLLATAVMAGVLVGLGLAWPERTTVGEHLLYTAAAVGLGGGVYLGLAALVGSRELRWLVRARG